MPVIAANVVAKPRRVRCCCTCGRRLAGPHIRMVGFAEAGDVPYGARICRPCAERALRADPRGCRRMAAALAALAAMEGPTP